MWKQTVVVDNPRWTSRFDVWAPVRTPRNVLQKLSSDLGTALSAREVRQQYAKLGMEPGTFFLTEFTAFVRSEMNKYQQVVKRADIQPM